MHLYISQHDECDFARVESFLMSQTGVVDAAVWEKKGTLMACVTVIDEIQCEENDLLRACEKALGPESTPRLIMLQRTLRKVA